MVPVYRIYSISFCQTRTRRSVDVYMGRNCTHLPPTDLTDIVAMPYHRPG